MMNTAVGRNASRGLAIPLAVTVIFFLAVIFITAGFFLREGTRQVRAIIDETVVLNICDAIIDMVMAELKTTSWKQRWYCSEGGQAGVSAADERGVYLDENLKSMGYEIDWYYFIEDVKDGSGRIIPYVASLFVQVTCAKKKLVSAVHCTLHFRPSLLDTNLALTGIQVKNYQILPPVWFDKTDNPEELKDRAEKRREEARKRRENKAGLNAVIEDVVIQRELADGLFRNNPSTLERIQQVVTVNASLVAREDEILELVREAEAVFRDLEIDRYNQESGLMADYDLAAGNLARAVQKARVDPQSRFLPRCLFLLGNFLMEKGRYTGSSAGGSAVRVLLDRMTGLQWPPSALSPGGYPLVQNDKSKLFKMAESAFYEIAQKYPDDVHVPASYLKLTEVAQRRAFETGKRISIQLQERVLEEIRRKIRQKEIPPVTRPFDTEDLVMVPDIRDVQEKIIKEDREYWEFETGVRLQPPIVPAKIDIKKLIADTGSSSGESIEIEMISQVAYSPSGDRTIFSVYEAEGKQAIYTLNNRGAGKPVRIYRGEEDIEGATVSPDGTSVAFFIGQGQTKKSIGIINSDGTGSPLIAQGTDQLHPWNYFSWSPDSRSMLFTTRIDSPEKETVCMFSLDEVVDNTVTVHIVDEVIRTEGTPQFSPAGTKILYSFWEKGLLGEDRKGIRIAEAAPPFEKTEVGNILDGIAGALNDVLTGELTYGISEASWLPPGSNRIACCVGKEGENGFYSEIIVFHLPEGWLSVLTPVISSSKQVTNDRMQKGNTLWNKSSNKVYYMGSFSGQTTGYNYFEVPVDGSEEPRPVQLPPGFYRPFPGVYNYSDLVAPWKKNAE